MTNTKNYFNTTYFILVFIVLLSAFYTNFFGIISSQSKDFQKDGEGLVLDRLTLNEKQGIFALGGLTGFFGQWGDPNYDHEKMYVTKNDVNLNDFTVYQSQIGGQAIIFGVLNSILPFDNSTKLVFFHFLTALTTALVFLFFLKWVKKHFGIITSTITLLLTITSFWIIIYSDKLFWNLSSFYLPFVFMLFYLDKKDSNSISPKKIFLSSTLLVFIKCFLTGYEFITTTLIMFVVPIIFYHFLNKWEFKKTIFLFLSMSAGAISGFLASIVIIIFQISKLTNKYENLNGLEYIYQTMLRRSYDDPNKHEGLVYFNSMKSTIWEVIQLYLDGFKYNYKSRNGIALEVTYLHFILFFSIITLLYFFFQNKINPISETKNKLKALIIMFWSSIVAPMSWFILFKSHSYIHTHLNFITWYMPFALLGYVLIGYLISKILLRSNYYKSIYLKYSLIKRKNSTT